MQLYGVKLNKRKVISMRYMRYREKLTYKELGTMFGVNFRTARRACLGITWRNVKARRLSDDDVILMRAMRQQEKSFNDIARRFNVSQVYATRICRGQDRCDVGGFIDLSGAKIRCGECNFVSWDSLCTECKRRGIK